MAVAEVGSATKAADFLCRAQSAVTRSVKELESSLGVPLFERRNSGMVPTVFGDALLLRAKRVAEEFELARQAICSQGAQENSALSARTFFSRFDLQQLAIFVQLAKLGHMPTVANQLGITQPAVSYSIHTLECRLGVALFKRTTRGMLLTDAGEPLYFRTTRALAELQHAAAEMSALNGTVKGRVSVGVLPLGRSFILPRAIAKAVALHPRMQVTTIEGSFDALATDLRAGEIDFILGALRPASYAHDLPGEPLLNDRMAIFVRKGHPLTQLSRRVTIDDLAQARWILPSRSTLARKLIDVSFASLDMKPPEDAIETSDMSILRDLLLQSDMVTAISTHLFYYERNSGELQILDFELKGTSRTIGITQRLASHPSPGTRVLMECIRQVVRELGAPDTPGAASPTPVQASDSTASSRCSCAA
jgi:LysR family transcriptional regulator of gallate degradation